MKRLGQEYFDYDISKGTGQEVDLLRTIHKFLCEHCEEYLNSDLAVAAEDMIDSIEKRENEEEDEVDYELISEDKVNQFACSYVNEDCYFYLDGISPIGTYFGNHVGSAAHVGFYPLALLSDFDEDSCFS